MDDLKESASQTAGPYVHIGCVPSFAGLSNMYAGCDLGASMITSDVTGPRIAMTGCVYDGDGAPVTDAMIEIWQAAPNGTFAMDGFSSWGRQPSAADTGVFTFNTLKPAAVGDQAPHILVWIVARGINLGLTTRIYFPDEDNSADAVFALVGARADTLVAAATANGYHIDIHLSGPNETVFFDV
ncbi:MAG: protocatechuate 3,4-dioxygenase subunit alpha [Octadecabacter sp.]|nr:protocatechuate 3,4-dioxygenase subunit alpha [Octadecabacter sp.]